MKPLLPTLLVTDSNIWIDLANGGILEEIFRLPCRIIASDFMMGELETVDIHLLEQLGLVLQGLEAQQVRELPILRAAHPALSVTDLAAYILARDLGAILVSGDRHLILLATDQQLTAHGVLWLLDELILAQSLPSFRAADALQAMIDRGARLPKDECSRRLKAWQSATH